ncbi:MAG TPA: tryptophan 7-halogenase [Candidatus Saccharimonadales bacterium]|nr:tryptophan 7-halogenase [Candidatus Saccharimonadales bacterium]
MNASPQDSAAQDVIIMGGALAGAAAALLLLRQQPGLRVLVIERSSAFTRRVGEATVEVSAYFLGRVLGLTQYLNEEHLVKQGMRFWFANDRTQSLEDCSEIGGGYLSRVPAYQVDRSTLDEEVLGRATAAGARLLRPAAVQKVMLAPGGQQAVTVRHGERTETYLARWVIDATGVAAVLARQQGWWRANVAHPITAVWSRWQGVKDWDGLELAAKFPKWSMACHGIRATATNHFMGPGWWAWCIPLKGGDVSVGVVFDERMVEWPGPGALGQRLKDFLLGHPAAREILQDARWMEGDVHWRKQLPYWSAVQAGDGFVLVGDAGGFLDPLYSPGMDWLAFTVVRSTDLILAAFRGEDIAPLVERQNLEFVGSYSRWCNALYLDKYEYLGDYELMRLGFLLDLGCYYLGVAAQPYKRGLDGLREPVFSTKPALVVYHLMRTYNRRLAAIARSRKARGTWGRANTGRRFMFGGYTFSRSSAKHIAAAFLSYAWLELTEGWRSWWNHRSPRPSPELSAVPSAVAPSPEPAPVLSEAQPAATAGTASRLSRA